MATKVLSQMFETRMDRKEFILYVGLIILTITGVTGVLKNITNVTQEKQQNGFGAGPYGK